MSRAPSRLVLPAIVPAISSTSRLLARPTRRVRTRDYTTELPKDASIVARRAMPQSVSMPSLTPSRHFRVGPGAAPRNGMPLEAKNFESNERIIMPNGPGYSRQRPPKVWYDEAAWVSPKDGLPRVIV